MDLYNDLRVAARHIGPIVASLVTLCVMGCDAEELDVGDLSRGGAGLSGAGQVGGRSAAGDESGGSRQASGGRDAGAQSETGGRTELTGGRDGSSGGADNDAATTSGGTGGVEAAGGATQAEGGAGAPASGPPATCDSSLQTVAWYPEGARDVCMFEAVCAQIGCGTIDGALDQCGNSRTQCSSNADCQADELCTPLAAFNLWAPACATVQCDLTEGECRCWTGQCASTDAWCTPAENVPEPCTEQPIEADAEAMVEGLSRQIPSEMAPEVRDPQVQCLERYRDSIGPSSRFCQFLCINAPDGCQSWCDADPKAAWDELVAVLVDSEQPIDTTPIARAMDD